MVLFIFLLYFISSVCSFNVTLDGIINLGRKMEYKYNIELPSEFEDRHSDVESSKTEEQRADTEQQSSQTDEQRAEIDEPSSKTLEQPSNNVEQRSEIEGTSKSEERRSGRHAFQQNRYTKLTTEGSSSEVWTRKKRHPTSESFARFEDLENYDNYYKNNEHKRYKKYRSYDQADNDNSDDGDVDKNRHNSLQFTKPWKQYQRQRGKYLKRNRNEEKNAFDNDDNELSVNSNKFRTFSNKNSKGPSGTFFNNKSASDVAGLLKNKKLTIKQLIQNLKNDSKYGDRFNKLMKENKSAQKFVQQLENSNDIFLQSIVMKFVKDEKSINNLMEMLNKTEPKKNTVAYKNPLNNKYVKGPSGTFFKNKSASEVAGLIKNKTLTGKQLIQNLKNDSKFGNRFNKLMKENKEAQKFVKEIENSNDTFLQNLLQQFAKDEKSINKLMEMLNKTEPKTNLNSFGYKNPNLNKYVKGPSGTFFKNKSASDVAGLLKNKTLTGKQLIQNIRNDSKYGNRFNKLMKENKEAQKFVKQIESSNDTFLQRLLLEFAKDEKSMNNLMEMLNKTESKNTNTKKYVKSVTILKNQSLNYVVALFKNRTIPGKQLYKNLKNDRKSTQKFIHKLDIYKDLNKDPHRIQDNSTINHFTKHILRRTLNLFNEMEKKSTEYRWKKKMKYLARSYEDKFNEFLRASKQYTLRTRLGTRKAILNAIDVSNRIVKRLLDFMTDDMEKRGLTYNNLTPHVFRSEISKEENYELNRACKKFRVCRSQKSIIDYIADVLMIMLSVPNKRFKSAFRSMVDAAKITNFTLDPDTQEGMRKKLDFYNRQDVHVQRGMVMIVKNIIVNRNSPLILYADTNPREIKIQMTLAFLEIINTLDDEVHGNKRNVNNWNSVKQEMNDWSNLEKDNLGSTSNKFMKHLSNALEGTNSALKNIISRNTNILFA